jgi:hypothetical protein
VADHGRKVLVSRVARHQFVKLKHRQGSDHDFAVPVRPGLQTVEAFDEQHIFPHRSLKADGRAGKADGGRQPNSDELSLPPPP